MRLISMKDLRQAGVPYSPAHIYRLISAGEFPKPVKLGANRIAFVADEIDAWIKAKVDQRDSVVAA